MTTCPHCHANWPTDATECLYCQWPERAECRKVLTTPAERKLCADCGKGFMDYSVNKNRIYCMKCRKKRQRESTAKGNLKKRIWKKRGENG